MKAKRNIALKLIVLITLCSGTGVFAWDNGNLPATSGKRLVLVENTLDKTNTDIALPEEIIQACNTLVVEGVPLQVSLDDFYIGPYFGIGCCMRCCTEKASEWPLFMEDEIKKLQGLGFNFSYLSLYGPFLNTDGSYKPNNQFPVDPINRALKIMKKYNFKVIPQLDSVYFKPNWTEEQIAAKAEYAAVFFKQNKDNDTVLAWSIKEEILPQDINKLQNYYQKILELCPGVKFNHQFHKEESAAMFPKPWPVLSGGIIYGFYVGADNGGQVFSPRRALDYTRKRISMQYVSAAKIGSNFIMTISGNSYCSPKTAWRLAGPESEFEYRDVTRKLCETGTLGCIKTENPLGFNRWVQYAAPQNCLKALTWISVMEGAKGVLCWSYSPKNSETAQELSGYYLSGANTQEKGEQIISSLWPNPYIPNSDYQLKEFSEAAKELREYGKIIARLEKVQSSPLVNLNAKADNCAFKFPGLEGWVIIMTSLDIGKWPLDNKYVFMPGDQIFFNQWGQLEDYEPFTAPQKHDFRIHKLVGAESLFDLSNGQQIKADNGTYSCTLNPGSGKFLYLGKAIDAQKLLQLKK